MASGQEVRTAHDGPTALEIAKTFVPAVVLLDIGLPGMSGFEVALAMRGMSELRGCRLIALTGYGQAQDLERSRDTGFDRHLVKPVDPLELQAILDQEVAAARG